MEFKKAIDIGGRVGEHERVGVERIDRLKEPAKWKVCDIAVDWCSLCCVVSGDNEPTSDSERGQRQGNDLIG